MTEPVSDTAPVGVLLTNLGTPRAPTSRAVRRYLAEFLRDRRVVELPRLLWLPILYGIVLVIRPRRSARAYKKIWTEDGSPLLANTRRQAQALQAALGKSVKVEAAMRYGRPSLRDGLQRLTAAGVKRILLLPLYPQYSATTTASTFDKIAAVLRRWRRQPALRTVTGYCDDPAYIDALANSVVRHWREHGICKKLMLSFHGIPQRYADAGDPYPQQCAATAELVAHKLGLSDDQWQLTFQSRFGRRPWLQPYTDKTLKRWGAERVPRVDVLCPGFSADCLETLEEIAIGNRELFLRSGGKRLDYIPALNDRPEHIAMLSALVKRELGGWIGDW